MLKVDYQEFLTHLSSIFWQLFCIVTMKKVVKEGKIYSGKEDRKK